MIPCLTLTDERHELDAQHMVCSYLVRACRQAMYELALEEKGGPDVRHRAVQVIKVVHRDWLEAQKSIAREMNVNSMPPAVASTEDSVADVRAGAK